MKTILLFLGALALIVIAYFVFIKPSTNSGTKDNSSDDSQAPPRPSTPGGGGAVEDLEDYFTNGDPAHDKNVFVKGLICAKDYMYKNMSNPIVKKIYDTNFGTMDRTLCLNMGINCNILLLINNFSSEKKQMVLNYLSNLNADNDWKRFANMAIGRKNMCSVILEQAYHSV